MGHTYEREREMFTLASIAYLGMLLVGDSISRRLVLHQKMDAKLATFREVKDRWEIIWGPANAAAIQSGLDDAVMYVARSKPNPNKLVIAIRGTNTLSVTDWLFGDFMVRKQVDWLYGGAKCAGAKISSSAAYGLATLLGLKYKAPQPRQPLERRPLRLAAFVKALGLPEARREARRFAEELWPMAGNNLTGLALATTSSQPTDGQDLLSLLRDQTKEAKDPLEVIVTGHSKGGTLCSVLSTFLADTQGLGGTSKHGWDPDKKAIVSAWSFAGPTAGNRQFAEHSNKVLEDRSHRLWNYYDVAPCAFIPELMRSYSSKFAWSPLRRAIFAALAWLPARRVEGFDYQQPGGTELPGSEKQNVIGLLGQIAYQHYDGYCEQLV